MVAGGDIYISAFNVDANFNPIGNCALYSLDATTGDHRWKALLGGESLSDPIIANSTAYVIRLPDGGTDPGFVYALWA